MKRYSEYKDSGVKWIGEIPGHWKTPKLNRVVSKVGSGSTPRGGSEVYIDEGIKFLRSQNIHFEGLNLDSVVYIPDSINEQMKNTQVQPFDVLLNITGGSIGRCFYVDDTLGKANVNQHVCIIRPLSVNYRFLKYFLQSNSGQSQVWFYQKGDREGLSAESIKTFRLPLPPLPEQEAIVTYLDSKVAKIDEYIAIAEKKIAALEELKQTIIAEAVTRGIHKDVPMKDSGVKWIGMIPEHWNMLRAKNIFERQFRPVRDCDEVVTCFRDGQVTLRKNRRIEGFTESLKEIGYQGIRKGDLVIHQMDAFAGSIGVSDSDGKGTPVYICCLPKDYKNINVYFYAYLLREMARSGFIKSLYRGIRERSSDFRFDTFSVQWLPLVPIKEQNEIVTYIEEKVANINQLCQAERSQIEKLKEYKQRLISDVVTGKVKVTND